MRLGARLGGRRDGKAPSSGAWRRAKLDPVTTRLAEWVSCEPGRLAVRGAPREAPVGEAFPSRASCGAMLDSNTLSTRNLRGGSVPVAGIATQDL